MTWASIAPAGNRIVVSGEGIAPAFNGFQPVWTDSGTSALALALLLAKHRFPDIECPEVILPAYGCPDLVAAAVFAGVKPVIADIGADDPAYAPDALQGVLTSRTIALVAVNFLGIRERLEDLRVAIGGYQHILLIEDSAQWFPRPDFEPAGDVLCLSFGRGKPVSLLGGGALLVRDKNACEVEYLASLLSKTPRDVALRLRLQLYNFLVTPVCYGIIRRLPFGGLGGTAYEPLRSLAGMDSQRLALLSQNVTHYYSTASSEAVEYLSEALPPRMNLPVLCGKRSGRLLRYPVLCDDLQQRNALCKRLLEIGVGATALYQKILPDIPGVPTCDTRRELHGARAFADRLLTLPSHDRVDLTTAERMVEIVRKVL